MVSKIQLDPNLQAFQHRVIQRLNNFSEVSADFTSADTATTFSHGLGKLPSHAILRISDKAAMVYATAADQALWTSSTVVLRSSNSNVSCTVKLE